MNPSCFKAAVFLLAFFWSGAGVQAGDSEGRLRESLVAGGAGMAEALFWLPETRERFRQHLPDADQWVGFEKGAWDRMPAEAKDRLFVALAEDMQEKGADFRERVWERLRRWQALSHQLGLMMGFLDSAEGFYTLAYEDELLRPVYAWILDRRPGDFDVRHVGETLASGEGVMFHALLVQRLLDSPAEAQYACFSRLYARLAAREGG